MMSNGSLISLFVSIHVSSLFTKGLVFPACSVLINEEDIVSTATNSPAFVGGLAIVVELCFLLPRPRSRNSMVAGVPPAPNIRSSTSAGLGPDSYRTIPITIQKKATQKYGVSRKPVFNTSKNAANKSLVSRRMFSSALGTDMYGNERRNEASERRGYDKGFRNASSITRHSAIICIVTYILTLRR